MCKFIALGGGNEVGGSCYALNMAGRVIILDAGIRYTANFLSRIPDLSPLYDLWGLEGLWDIDALIISHAHADHSGAIPIFIRNMNRINIYSSQGTPDMLYAQNRGFASSWADMITPVPYGEKYYMRGWSFTLYTAGHIPGAAMILIEADGMKILYTGDFCDFNQFTVNGAEIPDMKLDSLICETTYGYSPSIGKLNLHDLAGRINTIMNYTDTFTCTFRNSGKESEFALAVNECVSLGLIPPINIWVDPSISGMCVAVGQWGKSQVLGGRIRVFDELKRNITGCIISSCSYGGLYELGFNMSNHADCDGILNLIAKTKPDRIILVHGEPSLCGARNIMHEVRERFGTSQDIIHSFNGQEINLFRET